MEGSLSQNVYLRPGFILMLWNMKSSENFFLEIFYITWEKNQELIQNLETTKRLQRTSHSDLHSMPY